MGCFGPDAPEPRNYGQETRDTLQAQIDLAPQLYRAEASPAYGQPAYSALALQNLNTILGGVPGGSRVESYQETLPAGWYDAQGNAMPPGWYEQQLNAPTEYWKRAGYDARGGDGTHEIQWMPERQVTRQRTVPTTGAPGLLDLLRQANTSQRAGDIADVAAFAPAAREAILAANPDTAALLAGLNAQAREDLASGSQLSPAQIRQMQQASRAAFAARGLADSNISVADELFRQLDLGRQLKAERQMAALRILGANQTIVGDPWMQILGRPSAAVPLGQGQFGLTGPGLFNPESAYAGNLYNSNLQMESQFAMAQPSVMSMIGSGLSMGGKAISGLKRGLSICWVAREVYGAADIRWRIFQSWLLTSAPRWLLQLYTGYGEGFAAWLRAHAWAKPMVRRLMDCVVQPRLRRILYA